MYYGLSISAAHGRLVQFHRCVNKIIKTMSSLFWSNRFARCAACYKLSKSSSNRFYVSSWHLPAIALVTNTSSKRTIAYGLNGEVTSGPHLLEMSCICRWHISKRVIRRLCHKNNVASNPRCIKLVYINASGRLPLPSSICLDILQ